MYDLPCGVFNESYEKDMAVFRTATHWVLLIFSILVLFLLPLILADHWIVTLNFIAIAVIAVLGLNIVTGYCGQINVGQAAFMAVGAYTSAILTQKYGLNFWVAFPLAGLVGGFIGLLFGLPSLRLKGFYIAMSSMAAQFIILWVILRPLAGLSGGDIGLDVPYISLFGMVFNTNFRSFYIIMPVTLAMLFFAKNIGRMRMGRAFVAIRDNDLAAEVMGINIFRYKLLAFSISSAYAGIAGSLLVHTVGRASLDYFGFMESIWFLGMLIVGGMGTTVGPLFGVVFLKILDELIFYITPVLGSIFPSLAIKLSTSLQPIFFSLIIMLFIIYEPRGWAHRWEIFKNYYRLHPFSY